MERYAEEVWHWKWCNSFLLTSLCLELRHIATSSNKRARKWNLAGSPMLTIALVLYRKTRADAQRSTIKGRPVPVSLPWVG